MNVSSEDLSYAAGLLDGEGCIHIGRFYNTQGRPSYHLAVLISMTVTSPLIFMQERFGGTLRAVNRSKKQQWQWTLYSKEAVPFLEAMLPRLLIKGPEAAYALLFQDTFKMANSIGYSHGGDGGSAVLPEKVTEFRTLLWEACRDEKRFNA